MRLSEERMQWPRGDALRMRDTGIAWTPESGCLIPLFFLSASATTDVWASLSDPRTVHIILCMTLSNGGSTCQTLRDNWTISFLNIFLISSFPFTVLQKSWVHHHQASFPHQSPLICHLIWVAFSWQDEFIPSNAHGAVNGYSTGIKWRYDIRRRGGLKLRHALYIKWHLFNLHSLWSRQENGSAEGTDCCIIPGCNLRHRLRKNKMSYLIWLRLFFRLGQNKIKRKGIKGKIVNELQL